MTARPAGRSAVRRRLRARALAALAALLLAGCGAKEPAPGPTAAARPAAAPTAVAPADDEFLPPEQAFRYAVHATDTALEVSWTAVDGYYLYRKRMGFATETPGVTLGEADWPKGLPHSDEYFGEQEVYRGTNVFRVPYAVAGERPATLDLKLKLQGCADAGLCYPPQTWTTQVTLPAATAAAAATDAAAGGAAGGPGAGALLAGLGLAGGAAAADDGFLPPEQAFRLSAEASGPNELRVRFEIVDGYYLYKKRMKVATDSTFVQLGQPSLPAGLDHTDEFFGPQEIYRQAVEFVVPFARAGADAATAPVKVTYQGCADAGLCYPPQTQLVSLAIPPAAGPGAGAAAGLAAAPPAQAAPVSEQDRLAALIRDGNLGLVLATFFGLGLLLAFTPCVLPMVPILSGIIAGDGDHVTPGRGFALSLAYVLGMALTYTAAGAAFAAAGQQAQAFFQQTWIIVLFAGMFVALALAMFGMYELQMPSAIQTRLADASSRVKGGKFASTALMGALSSLVVTACVAPPLVAALAVIGQSGDVARGALALFALSFGMGVPLLVVGASAGKLLPKAGPWMVTVKAIFGVAFLGVAVWMLERILPPRATMLLWALVAFAGMWVLLQVGLRGGRRTAVRWAAGTAAAAYGAVLAVGAAAGGTDPLRPFAGTGLFGTTKGIETLAFTKIKTTADLDRELAAASAAGRRVMVDFYADWCVSCKEMEKYTFRDASVRAALDDYVLLKADVTANDADDQALLKRFGVYGPPTTAFFAADGRERTDFRLVGFVAAEPFRAHLGRFEAGS